MPWMHAASIILLIAAIAVLLAFLLPLWIAPPKRSVAISATTEKLTLVFTGTNRWLVRGAVLCDAYDAECSAQTGEPLPRADITWQNCDQITVLARTDPEEILIVLPPGLFGREDPVLYLDKKAFLRNGAQAFSGYLEIGEVASSGSNVLQTGDFSFYDRDALASVLDRPPDIVKTGFFRHGDAVTVIAADPGHDPGADRPHACSNVANLTDDQWVPYAVFGHVSLPADNNDRGLAITATSPASEVGLRVARFGLEKPLIIRPVWVDVVVASPAFLAVTILLTYLATVLQLLGSSDLGRETDKDNNEAAPVRQYRPFSPRTHPVPFRRKKVGRNKSR